MITKNLWVQAGIVNGAVGTLRGIVPGTRNQSHELPACLLIELDQYSGPPFIRSHSRIIPILPFRVQFEHSGHPCIRVQFPIVLAWALTIHKSQGLTLAKAVVELGPAVKQSGLTFVAVSRVRGLKDLAFLNRFPLSRLTSIATHKNTTNRLEEERRLESL